MEITEATKDDITGLCELLELFAQEDAFRPDRAIESTGLQQIIDVPERVQILVFREGTSLIGMVNVLYPISTAHGGRVALLEEMIVHPLSRGRGAEKDGSNEVVS